MDRIIILLIRRDYKVLQSFIYDNQFLDNDITNLLLLLTMSTNYNLLDDEQLYILYGLLFMKGININVIPYYDFILDITIKNKLIRSNQLIFTMKQFNTMKDNIFDIISRFRNSNGTIKKYITDSFSIKQFCDFVNEDLYRLVNSFQVLRLGDNIGNQHNIYSQEITDRIKCIVNIFGLNILKFIGVNIISNSQFNTFTFKEKNKYYRHCITKLNTSIYKLLTLFKEYGIVTTKLKSMNKAIDNIIHNNIDKIGKSIGDYLRKS
jgi:hypothetical protein